MFKLAAVKTVMWPVDVQIPQDGGKVKKVRFSAQFEILSDDEYTETLTSGDLLKRVLTGWEGVLPEEGNDPVEFNDDTKAQMLAMPYVRVALVQAYTQAASGREAARKN